MGPDSGIGALALEPNGDILAAVGYGNMGCWGFQLTMLTPEGQPVRLFKARLDRFWRRLGFHGFDGDAYVDGKGFTLVGAGQKPCFHGAPAPSATGLIAHFRANGLLVGRTLRFSSRVGEGVQPFYNGHGIFVVTWPYGPYDSRALTITARLADGSVDARFGNRGRVRIHAPWRGRDAALETEVSLLKANPTAIVIIATRYERDEIRLIRLHL